MNDTPVVLTEKCKQMMQELFADDPLRRAKITIGDHVYKWSEEHGKFVEIEEEWL